ncbi:unnamed protein product, partial [Medioppia subpectinata]
MYSSANMKSAVSSGSSSGSERVNGNAVTSSGGSELEDNKSKTNSRMSCASDDSCAINELLEGRMDLTVKLPKNASPVVINVERRTPMLDLLVNISTQYRFNAANYTINAGEHEFKASTPIGTIDVNQISIVPKPVKSNSLKSNSPSVMPFQTTFRLQVNLPRNQLMVLRVTPNATIAAIKQIICSEKALDANKYQLVRFIGNNESPHLLDPNNTLAFYTLNEVTLISCKTLSQIEMQFGAPTGDAVDMSPNTTGVSIEKNQMNSMIISQSNPDIRTLDDKSVLNHTSSGKQQKKRQAPPPPPVHSSATLPNRVLATEMNKYKDEKSMTIGPNDRNGDRVTETIIEAKPVLKVPQNNVSHIRQNSGSDSSGYHESVLSSDSPESTSATTPPTSSSLTTEISNVNNTKSGAKKRRAPPPPPTTQQSLPEPVNAINGSHNDMSLDESKGVLECMTSMSDVSLPLSTSSSLSTTSGTASSINNRSLSPIVVTQTNGSSTPLKSQTPTDSRETSMDSDSALQSMVPEITKLDDNSSLCESNDKQNPNSVICLQNKDNENVKESDCEDSTHLDNNSINSSDVQENGEVVSSVSSSQQTIVSKEAHIETQDIKVSPSVETSEIIPKATQIQLKVEVNCISAALNHDNSLSHNECEAQVVERDLCIDNT